MFCQIAREGEREKRVRAHYCWHAETAAYSVRWSALSLDEPREDRRHSHLRHGWYWGSQAFADRMLQLARKGIATRKNRTYRSAPLFRAHDERQAQRLLDGGLAAAGLSARELDSLPGSDVRKVALANLLLERTVARQSWIADKLAMRSAANVSQQVRRYRTQRPRLAATFREYLESVTIC